MLGSPPADCRCILRLLVSWISGLLAMWGVWEHSVVCVMGVGGEVDIQQALWDGGWLCLEEPGVLLPKMAPFIIIDCVIPTLHDGNSV